MNLKNPTVYYENVDRPNIFLEIRKGLPNVKKFDQYDELIKPIAIELKEKKHSFPLTIMDVENIESMGYFFIFYLKNFKKTVTMGETFHKTRCLPNIIKTTLTP